MRHPFYYGHLMSHNNEIGTHNFSPVSADCGAFSFLTRHVESPRMTPHEFTSGST
jgi:hypothetical protein